MQQLKISVSKPGLGDDQFLIGVHRTVAVQLAVMPVS
jgi:hypothetical protein